MTTPRVQAFSSRRINDKATETHSHDEGSQVAVEAHYLPNIYQDSSDSGTSQGDGQSDNQQLVNALRTSNTTQLRAISRAATQRPEMFDPNSSVPYWTNGSMTFERESKSAINRRVNWGGYRHKDIGGTGKANFTPHGQGHELSFADDMGVDVRVPRENLAAHTSVPGEFDQQIRHQLYSHQQPKGIRRDRLQVYNLTGVHLRA